jgi:hypothetical protein
MVLISRKPTIQKRISKLKVSEFPSSRKKTSLKTNRPLAEKKID